MFSFAPLRIAGDLLLIAVGIALGYFSLAYDIWTALREGVGIAAFRISAPPFDCPPWLWFSVIVGLHIAWSVVLVLLFGRDFYCIVRKHSVNGDAYGNVIEPQ